ncbi:ParB family protein [Pseudomonas cichorii]|nr:ParB family protein [Pseudomonas cichorii]
MMSRLSQDELKERLFPTAFRPGTQADRLADPAADTPMVLTIEQMIPYELNPRTITNSKYEEIKASVRARGLDQAPPVTRRPGEEKFIIRNGGNTRLTILKELWQETKEDRFFKINVLFRPWVERGEIVSLTGHLAENDLQGQLMFIERAVGIEKARELYETEMGKTISQSELARKLVADGYPISQPHISKMQETVRFLLPAIPVTLYSGLGKHQVERLLSLRKNASLTWEKLSQGTQQTADFENLFQDVLSQFDTDASEFVYERFQDELIGHMNAGTSLTYEQVLLDINEHQSKAKRSTPIEVLPASPPASPNPLSLVNTQETAKSLGPSIAPQSNPPQPPASGKTTPKSQALGSVKTDTAKQVPPPPSLEVQNLTDEEKAARIAAHVVTPVSTTERVDGIKRQIAAIDGELLPDFNANALVSIPVQAGGLHPISDVWYIERGQDFPEELRLISSGLARDIAEASGLATTYIVDVPGGLGFICNEPADDADLPAVALNTLTLLQALCGIYAIALEHQTPEEPLEVSEFTFTAALGQLLIGQPAGPGNIALTERLSDAAIVKLFRLIRLGRRLVELEATQETAHGQET